MVGWASQGNLCMGVPPWATVSHVVPHLGQCMLLPPKPEVLSPALQLPAARNVGVNPRSANSGPRAHVPLSVSPTEIPKAANFSDFPRLGALRLKHSSRVPRSQLFPDNFPPRRAGLPDVRAHCPPHSLLQDPPPRLLFSPEPGLGRCPLGSALRSPLGTALRGRPGRCRTAAGTAPPRARPLSSAPAPPVSVVFAAAVARAARRPGPAPSARPPGGRPLPPRAPRPASATAMAASALPAGTRTPLTSAGRSCAAPPASAGALPPCRLHPARRARPELRWPATASVPAPPGFLAAWRARCRPFPAPPARPSASAAAPRRPAPPRSRPLPSSAARQPGVLSRRCLPCPHLGP